MQPLQPHELKRADYERSAYLIRPPIGTPFALVLEPDFWANVSGVALKVGDLIEVVAQDGSYDADLRVVKAERLFAKVRVIRFWCPEDEAAEDEAPAADLPPEYRVEFVPAHKWRAVDDRTGNIVVKGLASKGEAETAVAAFLRDKAA